MTPSEMLEQRYKQACNKRSDINEHLPTLYNYASQVDTITEFGVRWVCSTWAFLMAKPKRLISYDLNDHPNIRIVEKIAKLNQISYHFQIGNTLEISISPTDLLFIDTFHSFEQCYNELVRHADQTKKYIILHDTTTYGRKGMDKQDKGLLDAIETFMADHSWQIVLQKHNNHGLTVMERQNA